MDAGQGSNAGDTQRHVCGLCWTSFSSPTELQQHCLQCFSEDNSETKVSEEGPPPEEEEETKDEEGNCELENSPSPPIVDAADEPDDECASVREDSPTTSSLPDGKTLHLCKLCPKTFTNYGSYRRHLRMHSCGHRYTCDICGKQFFRRYLWIKHYEKIHNSMMQNMCQCCTCEVWLKNSDTLKEHIRTKHRCVQSPSSDTSESTRKPSDTIVLDSVSLKPIPDAAKETSEDCADTEGKHAGGAPKCQWMCNICTESFATKAHLMKHKEDKHGRKRTWMSKITTPDVDVKQKKVSDSSKDLFESMLSEFSLKNMLSSEGTSEKPKKEQCSTVELPSTFSPTFSGGGLCDPTKRGVFLCEICKKTFINRSSYLRHKKMHTGVRPYICDQCCMSFFRSESLSTHKKKHAPSDPYKCFVCGHEDITATALSSHFISTHSKLPEEYDSNAAVRSKRGRPTKYLSNTMLCPTEIPKAPSASPRNVENQDTDANSDDTVVASLNGDADSPSAAADRYTCLVCFRFFPDEQAYYDHQCNDDYLTGRHQKDCSSQVYTNDTFGRIIVATCKLCQEKFSSEQGVFRHMVTHISCWPRICGYCGQYFKENSELTEHVLSEHSSQDDPIKHCFYCRQKFDECSALKGHVLEVHEMIFQSESSAAAIACHSNGSKGSGQNNVIKCGEVKDLHAYACQCEGCGIPFEDFKSSMLHFRDKHSTIVTFDSLSSGNCPAPTISQNDGCTKCREASAGSASPCNMCSRTFSASPEARAHEQEGDTLVDWYCCDACDASGPQDIMEKHVLSHLSKVGSIVLPEGAYRPSFLSGTTEPFWKVQEAFLDWCKNGSSRVKSLHTNGRAGCTVEMRTKTRSEILIEEAKRCTIQNGHVVPAPKKDRLCKDIIDLLPKNGEITMTPIKKDPVSETFFESCSFSQLRSALMRKPDVAGGDKNGNILKALLGERREPCGSKDQSDNVSAIETFLQANLSEDPSSTPDTDRPRVECVKPSDTTLMRKHSSAKVLLKCQDCRRQFTHYSSWKRHQKLHFGLSTHKCKDCHQVFYRKDRFDEHIKSHQNVSGT